MRKLFTRVGLLLALAGTALVACKREVDMLQLAPGAASSAAPPSLTELKNWYAGRTSASRIQPTSSSATASTLPDSLNWLAVRWEKLDTITNGAEPLAFLPIEGGPVEFTSGHQGYRRLVLGKSAGRPPSGFIIEVIHTGNMLSPGQVNQVFRALYNAQQQGQIAQLAGFTGFTALYSRENYYLTGRTYQAGVPSANRRWLVTTPVTNTTSSSKPGTAHTLDVDITCTSSIVNASTSLAAGEDVLIWTCSVSGRGGGSSTPPPYPGNGTGGDTGPGGGSGNTGGGTGTGGGGTGPIPNEQYDDGSGNGYGGYPPDNGSGGSSTTTLTTLTSQLQYNQFALVNPCPKLTEAWRPLLTFIPPQSVINRLNNLSSSEKGQIIVVPDGQLNYPADTWQIQTIQSAAGVAVNLDYFPIVVNKLPSQFSTPEALLNELRINFNNYINTNLTSFKPHPLLAGETALWEGPNPLGSIISIGIPGNSGSVITSSYSSNHWTFSTLHEPMYQDHPVSGTREFGFISNPGGGYIFYVRGADRIDSRFVELIGSLTNPPVPFLAADAAWESWQTKFSKFITDNGGISSPDLSNTVKNRPVWADVLKALRNNTPLTFIKCP